MEQQTDSKLGKEYIKAVYCHAAYLTYMQSITRKMLGCMKHKLESRLPGEISITSDMQMTPPLAESEEELKNLLMKVKEESENVGLNLNIQTQILQWTDFKHSEFTTHLTHLAFLRNPSVNFSCGGNIFNKLFENLNE